MADAQLNYHDADQSPNDVVVDSIDINQRAIAQVLKSYDDRIATLKADLSALKNSPASSFVIDPSEQPRFLAPYIIRLGSRTPEIYRQGEVREAMRPGAAVATASAVVSYSLTTLAAPKIAQLALPEMKWGAMAAAYAGIYTIASQLVDKPVLAKRQEILDGKKELVWALSLVRENAGERRNLTDQLNHAIKSTPLVAAQFWRYAATLAGAAMVARAVAVTILQGAIDIQHQDNVNKDIIPHNTAILETKKALLAAAKEELTTATQYHKDLLDRLSGQGVLLDDTQKAALEELEKVKLPEIKEKIEAQTEIVRQKTAEAAEEASGTSGTGKVGRSVVWKEKMEKLNFEKNVLEGLNADERRANEQIRDIHESARATAKEALGRQMEGIQSQLESANQEIDRAQAAVDRLANSEALMKADPAYKDPDAPMNINQQERALWQVLGKSYPTTLLGVGLVSALFVAAETRFLFLTKTDVNWADQREVLHRLEIEERDFKIQAVARNVDKEEIAKQIFLEALDQNRQKAGDSLLGQQTTLQSLRRENALRQELADIAYEEITDTKKYLERLADIVLNANVPDTDKHAWTTFIDAARAGIIERLKKNEAEILASINTASSLAPDTKGAVPPAPTA